MPGEGPVAVPLDTYDVVAAEFTARTASSWSWLEACMTQFVTNQSARQVLDVGCGPGRGTA